MTLTEFLLARIADDEASANDGFETAPHRPECAWRELEGITGDGVCSCGYPARVLKQCAAKRRIVEEAQYWERRVAQQWQEIPQPDLGGRYEVAMSMLRALAIAYVDHPDYREDWRP